MKKLIVSALFLTAFSGGLFANRAVNPLMISKNTLQSPATNKKQLNEAVCFTKNSNKAIAVQVCTNAPIPICSNGVAIAYVSMTLCASTESALLNLISSFQCTGGGGNQQ